MFPEHIAFLSKILLRIDGDKLFMTIRSLQKDLLTILTYCQFQKVSSMEQNGMQKMFTHKDNLSLKLKPFPLQVVFHFKNYSSQTSSCTAILVRNSDGKVMHGRNLDFQMWDILAKLVVNIEYYRGGERIFSVDTIVGSVFALTGIRHGAFAINVDTRKAKNFYDDLISVMIDDATPTCWLLRKTLQLEPTYTRALKRIKTVRIGGPVYYIISGVNNDEGCVIQRDTDSVHAFYQISETNWFIVQTNYDRDYPDPLHDPRRIPVEHKLRQRGNTNFTQKTLMNDFMSQWPTFNIATIMTAIMVPDTGYHNTTVWYGYNPSNPQEKQFVI